jgi:hypothetical protein
MASIVTLEAKAVEYEKRLAAVEKTVQSHAGGMECSGVLEALLSSQNELERCV